MEKNSVKQAMRTIGRALSRDPGYFIAWQANIAMAFKDRWDAYSHEYKGKRLSRSDVHIVANDAAEAFIRQAFGLELVDFKRLGDLRGPLLLKRPGRSATP